MNVTDDSVLARVTETIRTHGPLEPERPVVVAVSGGPDSVCLLDVLMRLGYPVEVAHFDHQTRDGGSGEDAAFVRALAGACGVPFHTTSVPVGLEAAAAGLSFETHARNVRYEFLWEVAARCGSVVVATGHHADDQAETVLMRIVRGATPHGLAGIPYVREEHGVQVVRPLLDCTRADIMAYLVGRGLAFREDATNQSHDHFRNRVRHELLPLLEQGTYNPGVARALTRLAEVQRAEDDYLASVADEALASASVEGAPQSGKALARGPFRAMHVAVQRRVVTLFARQACVEPSFQRVENARSLICDGATGERCDLGGGLSLVNGRDTTHLVSGKAPVSEKTFLDTPGVTYAFGRWFAVRYLDAVPSGSLKEWCGPQRQLFDADALRTPLFVRGRRIGDRFSPLGMAGSKKLQDYFVDQGVPAPLRDQTPLLVAGDRIAWVVGHGIDRHGAVTEATRTVLAVEVDYDSQ